MSLVAASGALTSGVLYALDDWERMREAVAQSVSCVRRHTSLRVACAVATDEEAALCTSELASFEVQCFMVPEVMGKKQIAKAAAAQRSPFDHTLVLDADTCVSSDHVLEFFEPLKYYDFVSAWEGYPLGGQAPVSVGHGWEPQTGAFAFRSSAVPLMEQWELEYLSNRSMYERFSSTDQQALGVVLQHSAARAFVLPARFNWRPYTLWSPSGRRGPVVVHDHANDGTQETALRLSGEIANRAFEGRFRLGKTPRWWRWVQGTATHTVAASDNLA